MAGKVERPTSQKFLSNFYELADFNPNKRLRAAGNLLKDAELEKYKAYVLDRLLKGLASGKTAARFGFSAFLTIFLDQVKGFEFNELKKKIDELLPFSDEKDFENAVGRHFAYTALENSELFQCNLKEIVQHHLELLRLAPYLKFSVVDAITSKAKSLDESNFKKLIYPSVKSSLNVELEKISLEGLLFLIGFSQIFPDSIKETKSFLNKKAAFRPVVYERILELLKCMDVYHKSYFCKELLIFSQKFDRFESVLNEVVLKFVLEGDECKSSERYFILCKELFGVEGFGSSELSTLLSSDFLLKCRKYSHRTEPSYRGHHILISEALEAFKKRAEQDVFSSSDVLVLIERIDNVESGDFDTTVGVSVRITEFLVSKLDGHDLEGFAKRVSTAESWSYKRLIPAFGGAYSSVKKNILKSFLCIHERSVQRFNVGCSLLEQIFKVKKHIHVNAKEEDTQIILDITGSKDEGIKERSLLFLAASLKYLGKIAESDEIATEYLNDAREVVLFAKSVKNKTALMDIFLSIISRVNRIHKVLVCYSIGKLGEVLDNECSDFIVKTIGKGANELEGDSDDDDDRDFKPITEEERQQVLDKWAKEEEEDESDGSEDEEEDDGEEEEEIDEALVSDMKKALGKYAFTGESDEDIEMDDAEIEDLDQALGAALKKNSKKGKRKSDENLSVFRNKCFDILIVFFTNSKSDVIVKSLAALAELITIFDTPEDEKLLLKIESVFEAVHGRKKEVVDSEVVGQVWNQIVEEYVANVRSVQGRRLLGDVFSFLLTFSADHQKLSLHEIIRTRVFGLVEAKTEEEDADVKATLQEVLEILLSKYPAYLVDVFPRIAELLAKETPEKSADLLKLITFACRKDVLQKHEGGHGLKLISTAIPTLEKLYLDLSSLKVNVFSKTVVFLYKFLVSATETQKEKLKKSGVKKVAISEDFKARVIKLNRDIQQECKCKVSVCIQRLESALN